VRGGGRCTTVGICPGRAGIRCGMVRRVAATASMACLRDTQVASVRSLPRDAHTTPAPGDRPMTTRHILVSALLAAMASSTVHAAEAGANANANAGQMAFEQLKQLTGAWRPAENPASALRVEFSLIAGDSVVTETWSAPGHASMTVYHLDGER